jgi:hypothetical protein
MNERLEQKRETGRVIGWRIRAAARAEQSQLNVLSERGGQWPVHALNMLVRAGSPRPVTGTAAAENAD